MAITNSIILNKDRPPTPGGKKRITERHTFASGLVHDYHYYIHVSDEPTWDFEGKLAEHAALISDLDAENEIVGTVHGIKAGTIDPATVVGVVNSGPDFDRQVLFEFMKIADVDDFRSSLDFFDAVSTRGGANRLQRAAYLGIDVSIWDQIDDRYNDLRGSLTFIDNRKGLVWTGDPS